MASRRLQVVLASVVGVTLVASGLSTAHASPSVQNGRARVLARRTCPDGQLIAYAPTTGFDPLTATDDQLRANELPPRPTDVPELAVWRHFVTHPIKHIMDCGQEQAPSDSSPESNNADHSPSWSGGLASGHQFTDVEGTWTVRVASAANKYVDPWVGLNGWQGVGTLFQGGTASWGDSGGSNHYKLWYQQYPAQSQVNIANVSVGDVVYVHVGWAIGSNAQIHLTDETTGYDTTHVWTGTAGSSRGLNAEWIVERPELGINPCTLPLLSKYGTETFTGARAAYSGSGWLTAGGLSASSLDMYSASGTLMSKTSSLSGSTIATTWNSSGTVDPCS